MDYTIINSFAQCPLYINAVYVHILAITRQTYHLRTKQSAIMQKDHPICLYSHNPSEFYILSLPQRVLFAR